MPLPIKCKFVSRCQTFQPILSELISQLCQFVAADKSDELNKLTVFEIPLTLNSLFLGMRFTITRTMLLIVLMTVCLFGNAQTQIRLKTAQRISQSLVIEQGHYTIEATNSLEEPLIQISGKNIVIDFNQSILQGSLHPDRPDLMKGLAIKIEKGSENITIKNLTVQGYKIAMMADSVLNLSILNCNFSYNYRPRLLSGREKEDEQDWMSYHNNEAGEWKEKGAGIYLINCNNAIMKDNIITGNQCALLMVKCNDAKVFDNNFSFNSGLGIGLYRSSNNFIYHNRVDFNIRGFSLAKYRRGQDSAGILVYEQSSENVFAYNSATHSGDGFFLWAGQSTLDTGIGGCNNNLIFGNDFSYASNNGVEITFSSNTVMRNRIWGCDYGIWGGYSFDSDISDNKILHNRFGIAIEHGNNINIALNEIKYNGTALKLWSNEKQGVEATYIAHHNTRSENYWIASNKIEQNKTAYHLYGTDTAVFSGNKKIENEADWEIGDRVSEIDTTRESEYLDLDYQKDKKLSTIPYTDIPVQPFPQGIEEIRINAWGPYNFQYPLLWLKEIDSNQVYHFEVLGKAGNWEIEKINGFEIIQQGANNFPSIIQAKAINTIKDKTIRLNYSGPDFEDQFGIKQKAKDHFLIEFKE
jgi:parallel beta-helix repeat protein